MAAAASCRRASQIGSYCGGSLFGRNGNFDSREKASCDFLASFCPRRPISQLVKSNEKGLLLVDTFALVKKLEAVGMPSKQAEAITTAVTGVLTDSLVHIAHTVVSKTEMEKNELIQETNLSKFKTEVQSLQLFFQPVKFQRLVLQCHLTEVLIQNRHLSLLQHENEKLRDDIEKMRNELRNEFDKVIAGQQLDLNLERGRTRDQVANQNSETCNLTNKLDKEVHALRAEFEAAKFDVIKHCIGTLVSISAVGLAVIRILK